MPDRGMLTTRPPLRFRRFGITPIRWGWFATLDLGRIYINLDFGWNGHLIRNFYIGGRDVE